MWPFKKKLSIPTQHDPDPVTVTWPINILFCDLSDALGIEFPQTLAITDKIFRSYDARQEWVQKYVDQIRKLGCGCH